MCAAIGYQVQSLKRIRIMDLILKNLRPGQLYALKPIEAKRFLETLGLR
jgi:16S rRNA U516 pseudouridylate synthase RsuA-like enzyme